MHWETKKNSCDSLYCDIRFIAVVWNRIRSISEVFLYLFESLLSILLDIYSLGVEFLGHM